MHISHSMMQTAKMCWKKYEWKYRMNLEPIEQRPALQLGKIVHQAFEMYYKGFQHEEVHSYILKAFEEERGKVEFAETEAVDTACAIAVGMWLSFPKDRNKFQEILPEKKFSVPFNGMPIEGSFDGLIKCDNKWWVREMKTTSLNRRQFKERMDVSEQATLYVWAAKQLGYPVEGVVYDGIHKPLLRKGANESCSEFCTRIIADYNARPEVYFQREYVFRSSVDMKHFEEDLTAFQRDLILKGEHGGYYRNHGSCIAFNSECQYKKICFEEKPDILTLQLFYKNREEEKDGQGHEQQEAAD